MICNVSAKCLNELQECPDDLENIQVILEICCTFLLWGGRRFLGRKEKKTSCSLFQQCDGFPQNLCWMMHHGREVSSPLYQSKTLCRNMIQSLKTISAILLWFVYVHEDLLH